MTHTGGGRGRERSRGWLTSTHTLPDVTAETIRIRWGLGDFAWAWPAVIMSQVVFSGAIVAVRGTDDFHKVDAVDIALVTAGSAIATLGILAAIAACKGRGTLVTDFGLRLRFGDWPWLAAGILLAVVANGGVRVIEWVAGTEQTQEVADALVRSGTAGKVFGALAVVIAAPLAEELLFRGLLLRALLRRFGAVLAVLGSGAVFALVHLLDPATITLLAPLALVGVVSGIRAVRSGELSQSILLHSGFNLLSAVYLLGGL